MTSVIGLILALGLAQSHKDALRSPLDKQQSLKQLRAEGRELAEYRFAYPQQFHNYRPEKPTVKEHQGSALTDRICEFRCKYILTMKATDAIPKKDDQSEFMPTAPKREEHSSLKTDYYILHTTIRAAMQKHYTYERMYPDQHAAGKLAKTPHAKKVFNKAKTAHQKKMSALTHELRIRLPKDYRPPDDMPRSFDAIVKVYSVEWITSTITPTLILHARLMRSKKLNLDAAGITGARN